MVVTFGYAYQSGRVALCARHAENPPAWIAVLGPVLHGVHWGECRACVDSTALAAFDDAKLAQLRGRAKAEGDIATVRDCDAAARGDVEARVRCATCE